MTVTRDLPVFLAAAQRCAPDFGPATARAAFLVEPAGLARTDCAADNRYTAEAGAFDPERAAAQHRRLHRALAGVLPTVCFAGDPDAPDDVFPNNVFATVAGRLVVGRMHHAVRRREAARGDIRGFFGGLLGYAEHDLSMQPHPCELTGALVIDRRRGLGFCGLSARCDEAGARLMHDALGLRTTLLFDLAEGEYHTNVVLAVLAGRAALVWAGGFADAAVARAIASLYAPHAVLLAPCEQAAFAANAIALSDDTAWMSAGADRALTPASRAVLHGAGLQIASVRLDAIEAAGGSLRCCVAEIF
ncbi:MAG TPA: arginine deiminase-related protein [Luteimonas sp.]|nr:arginine deiminase-related protein [Luteimonas sp.]